MKVYIVVRYHGEFCKIEKVFSKRKDAELKVDKLTHKESNPTVTYHVLTKSVHGLLNFGIPSLGKVKVYRMEPDYFKLRCKIYDQKNYIHKLEDQIKDFKTVVGSLVSSLKGRGNQLAEALEFVSNSLLDKARELVAGVEVDLDKPLEKDETDQTEHQADDTLGNPNCGHLGDWSL